MRRLLALVLVGLALTPGRASADTSDTDGSWWSELNMGLGIPLPVTLPTIELSPDLMVMQLPQGPAAVAAIRLPVADGTAPTTLTVHLLASTAVVGLSGCATVFTWASVRGGQWDARPQCNGDPVPLTLSDDTLSATLDVTKIDQTRITRDGIFEVLLQPTVGALPFSATIQPPVAADLASRPAPAATTSASPTSAAPLSASPSPRPSPRSSVIAVAPVLPPPPVTLPQSLPEPSAAPGPELQPVVAADSPEPQPGVAAAAARSRTSHTDRRLLAILLGLLAVVTALAAPMRERLPVLLTSRGAAPAPLETEAGLGRHRQPRTGRTPRL